MTPHEQAHKLVHDYYTIITGSPPGENVNQEALSEAIDQAREEADKERGIAYVGFLYVDDEEREAKYAHWHQVLNKLNEM